MKGCFNFIKKTIKFLIIKNKFEYIFKLKYENYDMAIILQTIFSIFV